MRIHTHTLAAAIAISLCLLPGAEAKQAPAVNELTALTRGVAADVDRVDTTEGQFTEDGAALALYGSSFRAPAGSAADMARAYLAADYARLGLTEAEVADFSVAHVREGSDFSVVRLRQSKQGIPVFGSDLAVSVTPAGRIIFVASAAVRGLGSPDVAKAQRTSAQALNIASSYLGVALKNQASQQMVYRAADGSTRVVWRVNGSPVARSGSWQLLIDAETGDVLRAEDIAHYADGTGSVYKPDPLSSARQTYNNATGYGDSPFGGAPNSDSPQLTAQQFPVSLRDITLTGANYTLVGPWADCREMDAPADGACPSQPSTDFSVTRSSLYFDAANVYYHIDTYMRYVNNTLGIPARPDAYATGVRFDPHGVDGDDNSNYDPGPQRLSFGQGDVDDAQDPDVIIHELGHGLHDWITIAGLSTVQGLSEGFGDYVASGYSRDFPNQWTPADPQYYWMFNWDGHNNAVAGFGWAGRVTNWQLTHTYATMGTSYNAGMYWASCNLVARDLMGGQVMDKAYFKGMSMTTNNTNQKVAAQAISTAATTLNYSNAQMTALDYAYNAGNTGGNTGCTYAVTVTIPPAVDLIFRQGFDSTP